MSTDTPTTTYDTKYGPLSLRFTSDTSVYVTTRPSRPVGDVLATAWKDDERPLKINGVDYRIDATLTKGEDGTWSYSWSHYNVARINWLDGDPTDAARRAVLLILDEIATWLASGTQTGNDLLVQARAAELLRTFEAKQEELRQHERQVEKLRIELRQARKALAAANLELAP